MKASERHNLKHDKAADAMAKGAAWARKHKNPLLVALCIVLFVCACIVFLTLSKQSEERIAGALLAAADAKAEIIGYLGEATEEKTVREIVTAYDTIAAEHPKSDAAPLAVFNAGQALMQTGRAEEASPYFRRVLLMAPDRIGLVVLARRGLAESSEASDKIDDAIANYSALLEIVSTESKAQAYWDIGRCYAELGQMEKARESLNQVVTIAPESAWAKLAQSGLDNPESLVYVPSEEPSKESLEVATPGFNVSTTPPLPEFEPLESPTEDATPSADDPTPPTEDTTPTSEE